MARRKMVSLPNPPDVRDGRDWCLLEILDASLFGSTVEGSACVDASRDEDPAEGETLEVGDTGACWAVGEYLGARDVFCDGPAHGCGDGLRGCVEDAAGDYRRARSGME